MKKKFKYFSSNPDEDIECVIHKPLSGTWLVLFFSLVIILLCFVLFSFSGVPLILSFLFFSGSQLFTLCFYFLSRFHRLSKQSYPADQKEA